MRFYFIKYFSCLFSFLLITGVTNVNGQVLQKTASKIKSLKNISYTDIVQTKFSFQQDFSVDTLISRLSIVPAEPQTGGYYYLKSVKDIYSFDGNKLISLSLADSTYKLDSKSVTGQNNRTLLYWAKQIEDFANLAAGKVVQIQDTLINKVAYSQIIVTVTDTVIDKEHIYTLKRFIIDKQTSLPSLIISELRGLSDDGTIIGLIEIHAYSNYHLDQQNFPDLSEAKIPDHFKLPVKGEPTVFLPDGTTAPPITGIDQSGIPLAFEVYKGKIVLLNFTLLGCPHCVSAARMLNNLHDKYLDKGFVVLNIYPFDKIDAIAKFDQMFKVRNKSFSTGKEIQQIYSLNGYPSFYLLNKEGLVAASYEGYYKELEAELNKKIDSIN